MSLRTLPILFLNMGGEMIYILDQRLTAQNVKKDKAGKVMEDIISTMFNSKFVDELWRPQEVYSRRAMRALFDRLAHASIMRLNANSMDKLFDLMTMAVKYQILACIQPFQLLMVTMNHFDGIRKMIAPNSAVQQLIDHAYELFRKHYANMNASESQLLRQTLLGFFQDSRVKISILLREKKQLSDGRFIIERCGPLGYGVALPGLIKYYETNGKMLDQTDKFDMFGEWIEASSQGSIEKNDTAGRGTSLGCNMYKEYGGGTVTTETQGGTGGIANKEPSISQFPGLIGPTSNKGKDPLAREELSLLRLLVSTSGGENLRSNFTLSLFDNEGDDEDEEVGKKQPSREGSRGRNASAGEARNSSVSRKGSTGKNDENVKNNQKVVKIDGAKQRVARNASLEKSVGDGNIRQQSASRKKKTKGEDMLSLMDSAANRGK